MWVYQVYVSRLCFSPSFQLLESTSYKDNVYRKLCWDPFFSKLTSNSINGPNDPMFYSSLLFVNLENLLNSSEILKPNLYVSKCLT